MRTDRNLFFTLMILQLIILMISTAGQSLQCSEQVPHSPRSHHYSYFSSNQQDMIDLLDETRAFPEWNNPPTGKIITGIVPHHTVAIAMIIDFYHILSRNSLNYERVIIIGPDHFQHGLHDISLSILPWETAFGEVNADIDTIQQLAQHLETPLDQGAFYGEHSISIQMDFVKKFLPEAKVIPVMMKPWLDPARAEKIASFIFRLLNEGSTILILSMDFAHDCTPAEAEEYDRASRKIVEDRLLNEVPRANVDCKSGLYTFLRIMNEMPESRIVFRQHTNSAAILNQSDIRNTTSYFTFCGVAP